MTKILLIGPPGVGKSTISNLLAEKTGLPHISTGDMIRQEIASGSKLGKAVDRIVSKGNLLDDKTITQILDSRLKKPDCISGYILEGYPRTVAQARYLLKKHPPDMAFELVASKKVLISRISGRRVCTSCGATFHMIFKPPKKKGICDNCGSEIILRPDDSPERVRTRLKVYDKDTRPIVSLLRTHNKYLVTRIPADSTSSLILRTILKIFKNKKK